VELFQTKDAILCRNCLKQLAQEKISPPVDYLHPEKGTCPYCHCAGVALFEDVAKGRVSCRHCVERPTPIQYPTSAHLKQFLIDILENLKRMNHNLEAMNKLINEKEIGR
jgi:hypothetical protein